MDTDWVLTELYLARKFLRESTQTQTPDKMKATAKAAGEKVAGNLKSAGGKVGDKMQAAGDKIKGGKREVKGEGIELNLLNNDEGLQTIDLEKGEETKQNESTAQDGAAPVSGSNAGPLITETEVLSKRPCWDKYMNKGDLR